MGHVAAVGNSRIPCQRIFLFLGSGKELGRVGKDCGYCGLGDAVVFEVDEAGILEAFEDGVSGLLLCVGIAREEGGEIDEL